MKKLLIFGIVVVLIGVTFLPNSMGESSLSRKIIYVDDDNSEGPWDGSIEHPYNSIQDAINAALNCSIIYISNGIYKENILIDKPLNLIGENRSNTIVDANKIGDTIKIKSSFITLNGLTIRNCSSDGWSRGLITPSTKGFGNISISDCIFDNNGGAIYLTNISNLIISNCYFHNNTSYSIYIRWSSNNISIHNCTIENNGHILDSGWFYPGGFWIDGEYRYKCLNIGIFDCNFNDNYGACIGASDSEKIEISRNFITGNNFFDGVSFWNVDDILVHHNYVSQSEQNGIIFSDSKQIKLYKNQIIANGEGKRITDSGVLIQGDCKFVNMEKNNITNNKNYGIKIIGGSNIRLEKNNFENNGLNAFFNSMSVLTIKWNRNFWDRGRLLPYPIFGKTGYFGLIPLVVFDWHPSKEPYDIL